MPVLARRLWAVVLCAALHTLPVAAQDAGSLRARHAALQERLAANGFGRPLHVESKSDGGRHRGEVYAVVERPFGVLATALRDPAHWCDILTLPANVKGCDASGAAAPTRLTALVTRKARDAPESAYRVDFTYEMAAVGGDYLRVALQAPSGPAGTRDYRIALEAAPIDAGRSFVHMSYAYALGLLARIAMDAYLATSGRDKVGFSVAGRRPDGRPVYVDGVRGLVERNAMRYYLAIEAYLDALAAPAPQRLEVRLRDWYAGTERYPQLREDIGREEYVRMKRREAAREAG